LLHEILKVKTLSQLYSQTCGQFLTRILVDWSKTYSKNRTGNRRNPTVKFVVTKLLTTDQIGVRGACVFQLRKPRNFSHGQFL